jgi:hypothetical protein
VADGDSKVVDLQDLNPEFQRRLGNLLTSAKAAGIPAHIIEAYRDRSVQAQYYAEKLQGKRPYPVAPPGTSFHEGGFASDVLTDDRSSQQKLIDYANAHPEFGVVPLPGDAPHFQIAGYRHLADALKNPPAYQGGEAAPDLSPFIAGGQGYSVAKGYTPYNPGTMVAGPGAGTTINAASAPVAGALATPANNDTVIDQLSKNIAQIESGGHKNPYEALGPQVGDRGQAIGKYQVMPENIPGWTLAATGKSLTPDEFKASPEAQEAVFRDQMRRSLQLYGPKDAASIWFTGKPYKLAGGSATDGNTTNADYTERAIKGIDTSGATSAVASGTTSPTSPTSPATPAPDKSLWDKLTTAPTDAEGKPIAGAKSPMQELTQASISKLGSEGQTERQEQPAQSMLGQGPGARNISPGLANIAQTYGQTLNSFSTPLTWGHGVRGAPGMPIGGLQAAPAVQTPGLSLTSLPAGPGGFGYGIDPNLGYGFG